ncbi:MAG TPA: ABC transporter permease [Bryobacteraceae bacterium]|nr:ABC transporter permease [Bryobacteraceae bacterium]
MNIPALVQRNLAYFWRINIAVVIGVATAVAVLAGAMVVGDSVRASLRDLAIGRLGRTDVVISAAQFFREALAGDLARGEHFSTCPMIAFEGLVTQEASGRRASGVSVYGVDDRFWQFQGTAIPQMPAMSQALADELGAKPGDSILLRVEKPSVIPLESLHGRKEDVGRTLRFTARAPLGRAALGEFSIRPQQGEVRAIFVPLNRFERDLGQAGKVNTILVAGETNAAPIEKLLRERYTLGDLGLRLRALAGQGVSLESESAILSDGIAGRALSTAQRLGIGSEPVYAYLANTIRSGTREIPYSLVVADDEFFPAGHRSGILLNDWAAQDLGARAGETIALDYYIWKGDGRLHTETAQFSLAGVLPIRGAAADRNLAPEYPGITESNSLHDWDPPFPIDLGRVRPRDEDYWKKYRTTPKAFLPLAEGQKLWGSRFGKLTSIRLHGEIDGFADELRGALDPTALGFTVSAARTQAREASAGSTDFGEYFVYFSFFLMAAALLLAALFFRLGVEQRLREIGMFRAMGFREAMIRKIFLAEGAVLALGGGVLGAAGASGYAELMVAGLRARWAGTAGMNLIRLHVTPEALATGSMAGFAAAVVCILWTLRGLRKVTPRGLLARQGAIGKGRAWPALVCLAAGAGLVAAARWIGAAGSFFGGGTLLLAAALFAGRAWLGRRGGAPLGGIPALGFRNAAWRPGRSILCIALIAAATFLIIAVDAFRREERPADDPKSGTGGFALMAESLLPVIHDPNSAAGRELLNLTDPVLGGVGFSLFRVRRGDDASCLNLYQPRDPRVLAPVGKFISSGRFAFQDSLAKAPQEKANPWLLLEQTLPDGAIPAIADATSMEYALHRKLGEDVVIQAGDQPVRLRLVAAIEDSIFQGELLISEKNFLRAFPDEPGYRFFLIDAPAGKAAEVTGAIESALSDYGFDVTPTATRLAAYHRVENTYISTFQMLGALGLLLGTLGLAAVLARNVLERRRELALLEAVGYKRSALATMILAENALLLVGGLAIGAVSAVVAIIPAIASRGGHVAAVSMAGWLAVILAVGLAATGGATMVMIRLPLIPALRSE